MDKAMVSDVVLEFEVTGSGEPVLLISSGPIADSFLPFRSQQTLFEQYRLITYHQRGQAGSTRCSGPVSFREHAADAVDLLDHLGIRRAHVVGHSTGAVIALQLAADCPGMVHTLALLEPTVVGVPSAVDFLPSAPAVLDALGPSLAAYTAGEHAEAMETFLSVACSLEREDCRRVIEKHVPGGVEQAIKDADTWFGGYMPTLGAWQFGPKEAAAISQPVLAMLGSDSGPLYEEGHALMRRWFPQLEECTIAGVGHLLHLQCPKPVAQGVAEFLARHPIRCE